MQQVRIIIAGGGTGGHIFPAVAIGHALKRLRPVTELLFVGAKNKMEMEKIPQAGFSIKGLDIAGYNRSHLLSNITLPWKMLKSYLQAVKILKEFKPDAVVGVGGYASFPVLYAAQRKNIPTLIQEQNSYAGKSNKILAKKAKAICVAYDNMNRFFPAHKLFVTGNPVRNVIAKNNLTREEGQLWLGLDPHKPTLLIVGGSLGAKSINEAIAEGIQALLDNGVQILWQTGKLFFETAQQLESQYPKQVRVMDFIREMEYAYACADIVVSRAGALAISELCIVAKPVVFVPYPYAAEDHQTSNAQSLVQKNAAVMVKDHETKKELVHQVIALLQNKELQKSMHHNLKAMAICDADEKIATKVFEIANSQVL